MLTADEARKLSKEWSWWDTLQLNKYKKKIKRKCKKGEIRLVSVISPRPRVVEKLKEEGYKVVVGYPLGIVIDW